ncbi:MAG TPA: DUF6429 family protein [Polyangia bacterium]
MKLDIDRIDEAVLALLSLGRHDGARVWKTFDWDVMERLHSKGYISDPVGKAKSVALTEHGLKESDRLLSELFGAKAEEPSEAQPDH